MTYVPALLGLHTTLSCIGCALSFWAEKKVVRAFLNGGNLGGNLSEVCFKRRSSSFDLKLSRVTSFGSLSCAVEEPVLDPWNDY